MTNKILLSITFFLGLCSIALSQEISTSSNLSLQDLIQSTLIQSNSGQSCVKISNVSSAINGSVDDLSSYGQFTKGESNFPFQDGLVLTTGNVISAGNSLNTTPLNEGTTAWGTDPDLETALGISNTMNATSIEFDFISAANGIAFNYLLASEEYFGTNPCRYSDGFAFLIKESGSSAPYTNIALIPGTSLPVNTMNIRPKIDGFCPAENPAYFDGYNVGDTNYNGRTKVLTASTNILPNVTYHIKIVIADQLDPGLDSAVFIEGNSFNSTVDLGPDIITCANSTILNTNIANATYVWYKDGNLIAGEKESSLNINQSGIYKVKAKLPLGTSFCEIEDEISVTLNVQESLANIPDYVLCDDSSNNGKALFDLTSRDDDVLQSLPPSNNYDITYHVSPAQAEAGSNPITTFENTANPQDIYIRINDISNSCVSISGVRLIVNQSPPITKPNPLQICDTDDTPDGFTEIDLTQIDPQITSNISDTSDVFITYHNNSTDANSGENPIFSPYTNTSANQTLYVRLYDSTTGCFNTTTLDVNVSKSPVITTERPFINACNAVGNGFAIFDLTSEISIILNGLTDVSSSVHKTYADAEANSNVISNPSSYQNTQSGLETVYVRVVDNQTGCLTIFPLELHANIALTGLNPNDFNGCDNLQNGIVDFDLNSVEGQLLNDYEGLDVEFFENADGQQNGDNPLDKAMPFEVTSETVTIYAFVTSPECEELIPIDLVINPPVILPASFNVEDCSRNQSGGASVFLNNFDAEVDAGIQNASVQYYEDMNDALNDENRLEPNYYITNSKTLYVRVTNTVTTCFDIAPINIIINKPPIKDGIGEISVCEETSDGYAIVDLTSEINNIVSDTTGLNISYYQNYNLAEAGDTSTKISDPTKYRSSPFKYIAVRIENSTTGCFSVGALYIYVNSPPQFTDISNFQNCTSDGSNVTDFYFSEKDEEILNGQTEKEVLYFETAQDAEDRINIIDKFSAFRNNPSISQTIYVRLEATNDQSCYGTSSFVLEVDNLPSFNEVSGVFLCDDLNDDGFTTFDLSVKEAEIRTNVSDEITFYRSDEDAQNKANRITNLNFTNTANPQSIFARIDNGSFCYSLTTFSLNVAPIPKVEAPSDLYFCDANLSGPGVFDLEVVTILDLRPDEIEITYHESPEDLASDIQIINPKNYTSTSNMQTVFAKIKNTTAEDNCYTTLSINLNTVSPPSVIDFKEYPICTNPDNYFDLTIIDGEITSESNILITYFNSSNAAIANEIDTALDPDYIYITSNDRVYARLENTITGCISYYDFELIVSPLPGANIPTDLEGCDDDYDSVLVFDLSNQTQEILGGQSPANYIVTYYKTQIAANDGSNALNNLYAATDAQVIYARVVNTQTGCFNTTQFSTIVHPKPIVDIPDQAICSDNPASSVIVNADTNNPSDTYLWSTGETTSEIEIGTIGSYSVTVTGDFGCQTTTEFGVLEYESATIESIETVDFSDPNNITITVSGSGEYLYILDDGPPQESNVFENVTLGYHTVRITDIIGCTETTKEVVVIDAPKFITPNNDGYFDTWHISGIETLPGSIVYIFDRYGKLITTLDSSSQGWDGRHNGRLLPSTDYWFLGKIKKNDNTFDVKGHFTLKY